MTKISKEEKDRILAIAGNPHNGAVFPLLSIPNGYRIISRVYSYDPKKKRSANQKLTLGVVIDGKYMTKEEYHSKFTKRGFARVQFPKTEDMPEADASNGDAPSESQECAQGAVLQSMLGAVPFFTAPRSDAA